MKKLSRESWCVQNDFQDVDEDTCHIDLDLQFVEVQDETERSETELSFNLFGTQKVVHLENDDKEDLAPVTRPQSCYAATYSPQALAQFEDVAVTGDWVKVQAARPLPALTCAHRVLNFSELAQTLKHEFRKRRPGKKMRAMKINRKDRVTRPSLKTRPPPKYGPERIYVNSRLARHNAW